MKKPMYVTLLLVPDGTEARRGWRVRRWLLNAIVISLVTILVGIVLFFAFYGKVLQRAAMTEQVLEENKALQRYQYKVQLLDENLKQAREIVGRLTRMAGIEYEFPEIPDDSTIFAQLDKTGAAVLARNAGKSWTNPKGLPIEGFVTRGFQVQDQEQYHPGVDIACAVGTPVLATGSGEVILADVDSVYGNIVVIKHNDSTTTIYGHNDKLLVQVGQEVRVGSRIALSGNTGQSTAPHLHYEIRIHDNPLNPLEKLYD
jgi:murein DD-endopeptidase MepM/ murein hydrolase activator NlpD